MRVWLNVGKESQPGRLGDAPRPRDACREFPRSQADQTLPTALSGCSGADSVPGLDIDITGAKGWLERGLIAVGSAHPDRHVLLERLDRVQ